MAEKHECNTYTEQKLVEYDKILAHIYEGSTEVAHHRLSRVGYLH